MPVFIVWKKDYAVNVESMDSEHKEIFGLINQAFAAKQEGRTREFLDPLIEELIQYAMNHFSNEEVLLKKHQFPELDNQIKEHRDFVKKVSAIKERQSEDQVTRFILLFDFLKEWWLDHIQVEDKKYSSFLNEKGVR